MLKLVLIVCFSLLLVGNEIDQTLIIDGNKNSKRAKKQLYKVQKQFSRNKNLKKLQKNYHFNIEIEEAYGYNLIVVKPIYSQQLKEELLIYASYINKDLFFIKNKTKKINKIEKIKKPLEVKKEKKRKIIIVEPKKKILKKDLFDKRNSAWYMVLLLFVIGIVMVVYQRKKIMKLRRTEKEIKYRQDKMGKEIKVGKE